MKKRTPQQPRPMAPRRNPRETEPDTSKTARIVELLSVRDTRTYVEVSPNVWVVDNDSGEWRECPRCGQQHVIHATVRLDNGRTEILGKECARRDSPSMAKKVDAAFSAQASEDKLRRSIASLSRQVQAWERAKDAVAAMTPPPTEVLGYLRSDEAQIRARDVPNLTWGPWPSRVGDASARWYVGLRCGDVFSARDATTFYVGDAARIMDGPWRQARLLEATGLSFMLDGERLAVDLRDAQKKLTKLLAKRERE